MKQFARFCLVGGFCFLVDYVTLTVLVELLELHHLLANIISFTLSVLVNYMLSMRLVFHSKNESKQKDLIIFVVLSLFGLGINEVLLYLFVGEFGLSLTKISATGVVMCFNFISRKFVYERG